MEKASKILGQLAIWRIDSKNFIQACSGRVLQMGTEEQVPKQKNKFQTEEQVPKEFCRWNPISRFWILPAFQARESASESDSSFAHCFPLAVPSEKLPSDL